MHDNKKAVRRNGRRRIEPQIRGLHPGLSSLRRGLTGYFAPYLQSNQATREQWNGDKAALLRVLSPMTSVRAKSVHSLFKGCL